MLTTGRRGGPAPRRHPSAAGRLCWFSLSCRCAASSPGRFRGAQPHPQALAAKGAFPLQGAGRAGRAAWRSSLAPHSAGAGLAGVALPAPHGEPGQVSAPRGAPTALPGLRLPPSSARPPLLGRAAFQLDGGSRGGNLPGSCRWWEAAAGVAQIRCPALVRGLQEPLGSPIRVGWGRACTCSLTPPQPAPRRQQDGQAGARGRQPLLPGGHRLLQTPGRGGAGPPGLPVCVRGGGSARKPVPAAAGLFAERSQGRHVLSTVGHRRRVQRGLCPAGALQWGHRWGCCGRRGAEPAPWRRAGVAAWLRGWPCRGADGCRFTACTFLPDVITVLAARLPLLSRLKSSQVAPGARGLGCVLLPQACAVGGGARGPAPRFPFSVFFSGLKV